LIHEPESEGDQDRHSDDQSVANHGFVQWV
jgi:hypothetical protein